MYNGIKITYDDKNVIKCINLFVIFFLFKNKIDHSDKIKNVAPSQIAITSSATPNIFAIPKPDAIPTEHIVHIKGAENAFCNCIKNNSDNNICKIVPIFLFITNIRLKLYNNKSRYLR